MKLFTAFTETAPNRIFLSMILGGAAGICYALLIPIILSSISSESQYGLEVVDEISEVLNVKILNYDIALVFLFSCMFILVTRTISQVILIQVARDVTSNLRLKIYQGILKAPLVSLDKYGSSKLLAIITEDVGSIIDGCRALPNIIVNVVTLMGLLGFLFNLNPKVFWYTLMAIFIGIVTYQIPMSLGNRYFRKGRVFIDDMLESIRGLIYGIKELKLNHNKRKDYYQNTLMPNENRLKKSLKKAEIIIRVAANYGDLISFFVIGFIAFIFINYNSITKLDLIGVIMALLYITGPISVIINSLPQLMVAKVSGARVQQFMETLPSEDIYDELVDIPEWNSIHIKNLKFSYDEESDKNFHLGPLDLDMHKGEITFIVGGNGSGKSSLCKLISLHYPCKDGQIFYGTTQINNQNINSARNRISAIYTDFYLFEKLLGDAKYDQDDKIRELLGNLDLSKRVTFDDGFFSTVSLSDGQRKRLALLIEFLEDKDIYIFDEWAADQDPEFKKIFYQHILPQLRDKNKVVIAISHDDRYFDIADQLIVMEEGKVEKIVRQEQQSLVKANG